MILICLLEIQVKGLEIGNIFQSLGEVYEGLRCQIDWVPRDKTEDKIN